MGKKAVQVFEALQVPVALRAGDTSCLGSSQAFSRTNCPMPY
ncbi:MAG: hypothetical protein AB7D36_09920 [Oscillospiraceae bacterium]